MENLISYNNDPQLKSDLLIEVERHEKLDQIIQGYYGKENGKWTGCAVGCAIHSLNLIRGKKYFYDDHSVYEKEFGIPRIIARLQDRIFEGLSTKQAKRFPYKFLAAVPLGKNLDNVWRRFLIWLLVDANEGVIRHAKTEQTKKAIQDVADLIQRSLTEKITTSQFNDVRRDAAAAADAAADAAYAAAYAAASAADAADAADAAYAAADAADAAAYAAASAAASAADAARKNKFSKMADKLIELLQAA